MLRLSISHLLLNDPFTPMLGQGYKFLVWSVVFFFLYISSSTSSSLCDDIGDIVASICSLPSSFLLIMTWHFHRIAIGATNSITIAVLLYVTRFYKTNPNRTSGKIKLIPPVDNCTIVLVVLTLSTTQTTRGWFQQMSFLGGV